MGTSDGSIIATIITVHMATKETAAPAHVWPGIRIHAIDIDQPPGIGIVPIPAMEAFHSTVAATLPMNSSATTPAKARLDARSDDTGGPDQRWSYSSCLRHQ